MKTIIFATGNENKMKEIRQIMEGTGVEVCSMKEAGISCDVEENGTTFSENACIKAEAIAKVAASITGEYIDYTKAQSWNGQVSVVQGSSGAYFDISSVLEGK